MPMEETTTEVALDILTIVAYGAFGFVAGALLSLILGGILRALIRRRKHLKPFTKRLRLPVRVMLILAGTGLGILIATGWPRPGPTVVWRDTFVHGWTILLIIAAAFVLTGAINAIQDSIVSSRSGAEETTHARRVRTQTQVITRVGVAVVWILAISGTLLTFEQFRAIGASMLASAGLLSIVAGLAAQSSLANIFAGIQLAFTDALRVGDLVIVDEHWGTIEEITLTYVVVASWDGRRWIVPSTVFISKTFENWTRREPQLMGTVEFDLDWLVPVEAMRVEVQRIVKQSDLWDGRYVALQVTDATGGSVKVRATVSAATSGDLWDLRCHVREELINWLQHEAVYALPRTRLEPETTTAPPTDERDEFVEDVKRAWEDERADDATKAIDMAALLDDDEDTDETTLDGRRSWFQAIRDRRAATREVRKHQNRPHTPEMDALIASVLRQSDELEIRRHDDNPDTLEMPRVEITDGSGDSLSATARLFSGSAEADERNRRFAGPTAEEIKEREERAINREREHHLYPQSGEGDESR